MVDIRRQNVNIKMRMEHWYKAIRKENPEYSKKSLNSCHHVRHKYHTDWVRIETGPPP